MGVAIPRVQHGMVARAAVLLIACTVSHGRELSHFGLKMGQLRSLAGGMSRRPACPAFSRQLLRDRELTEAPVEASAVAVCEVYV